MDKQVQRIEVDSKVTYYPEYWKGKRLAYPHVHIGHPKFAKSIEIGNLIYISGCTGQNTEVGGPVPETFEEQMISALDKVKGAMELAGSSLNNVVKTNMLLVNPEDYALMRKIELEYYQKHAPYLVENPPASTLMGPRSLALKDFKVEIEVFGVITRDDPECAVIQYPEYWNGKKLAYPHVPAEAPKYARSAVVGNTVFVSGCEGLNRETGRVETDDFEEQMIRALDKVKLAMEEAGGSLENIVKTHVFLTDLADYPGMRKIEKEYYEKHAPYLVENPPASTFVQVAGLAMPEFKVTMDAVGVVSRDVPGSEMIHYPEDQTVVVGDMVYLSGCVGTNPETGKVDTDVFEEQMNIALDKARVALEKAGTSMEKVVKTFMYIKDLDNYPRMRQTETEYYQKHAPYLVEYPPVSTFSMVDNMVLPELVVQVDIVAML